MPMIPTTDAMPTAQPQQANPGAGNLLMAAAIQSQDPQRLAGNVEADQNPKPQYFEDTFLSQQESEKKDRAGAAAAEKRYDDKLREWRDKAKEGDFLILRDQEGYEYWHRRNEDYAPGWQWWPKQALTS